MKRVFNIFLATVASVMLLGVSTLQAQSEEEAAQTQPEQEESQSAEQTTLPEIVVTAERRITNLQTVPVPITMIKGDTIEKLQIETVEGLSLLTPSMHVFAEATNSEFYTIRGIGRSNEDLSSDPGVAVYVNDIYIARQGAANAALFDVERIEVLRGPQGTLYGKNATGGAVNIIPRMPEHTLSGYAAVDGGEYDTFNLRGAINIPVAGEKLLTRVSFLNRNRDGLYRNLSTGEAANNTDAKGFRASFLSEPTENFEIYATLDWENSDQVGVLKSVIVDVPGTKYILKDFFTVSEFPTQEENVRTSRAGTNGEQGLETYGGSLRLTWRLAAFDFVSITGYREETSYHLEDNDRAIEKSAEVFSDQDTSTISQEFRLVSNRDALGGRLTWAAGLYYFNEDGIRDQSRYSDFFGPGGLVGPGSPEVQQSITTWFTDIETNAWAVYGQGTFAAHERLGIILGIRYTDEEKKFGIDAVAVPIYPGGSDYSLFIPGGAYVTSVSESWDNTSIRAGLEWRVSDDVMTYLTYSEGFKSGGYDGQAGGPNLVPFRPELAKNYELGLKSQFASGRVRTNVAVFHSDFEDLQQQGFSETGVPITSNAAESQVEGLEVEGDWLISSNWTLSAGVSLMDTEYTNWFIEVFDPTIQGGPPFRLVDKSGDRIGLIPKYSANARLLGHLPVGTAGRVNFQLDFAAVSDTITAFNTLWSNSYNVWNTRISWESSDATWELALWLRNITDEFYYRGGGPVPDIDDKIARLGLVADPRLFGLTLEWRFGE
jgi:iron complex outermembrane receptor protein